jgi:predicted amidohydrolase YtcJ
MILMNGSIYTMRKPLEKVEAVAIKGQSIIDIGDNTSIVSYRSKSTTVIDLHGKTVLPGFIESHGHLAFMGIVSQRIKISELKSEMEVADLVRGKVKTLKPSEWLLSQGWDQAKWGRKDFPNYQSITDAAPNNPVLLTRVDGHTAWINKKAMEIAGIDRHTKDPDGGEIIKDPNGDPTGILLDKAQELVARKIPEPTVDQIKKSIDIAIEEAMKNGFTTFEDLMTSKEAFFVLKEMARKRRLKIRIYAVHGDLRADMLFREKKWTEEVLRKHRPLINFGGGFLTARAIKILADGSLSGRGAALLQPYSDQPNTRGILMKTEAEIASTVSLAMKKGYQVATHAIGDLANQVVLNGYEKALADNSQVADPRLRIEHTQVILPSDIPRMSRSKIIASMQPNHCTADMVWIDDRLGAERAGEEAFLWKSILSAGVPMAFGSDAPFGDLNPLLNVYAAITRQNAEGRPPEGWHPEQRLDLFDSIKMYTASAAFAAFEEKSKGLIEKGKLADFTVLSQDPFQISASELLKTRIDMTIVGGKIVYRNTNDK